MFSSPFPKIISFICKDSKKTKNVNIHEEEERILWEKEVLAELEQGITEEMVGKEKNLVQ